MKSGQLVVVLTGVISYLSTTTTDPWSYDVINAEEIRTWDQTSLGRLDVSGLNPWSRWTNGHVRKYEHTRDSR